MTPRLYAELIGTVVLLGIFWWYSAHERGVGEAKCQAAIHAAYESASSSAQSKHEQDLVTVTHIGDTFDANTSKPLDKPAPVIRVCNNSIPATSKARASSASSEYHEAGELRAADTVQPTDWNSKPVVQAGRDADEQVKGLQTYIKDVCLK